MRKRNLLIATLSSRHSKRTLGLLIALVALAAVSLMLVAREATPSHAAGPVTVSLDAVQKGSSTNACPVVNEAKCTLNAGDTFDVVVSIKGSTSKVIPYQDWTFDVVHTGLADKIVDPAVVVNSAACPPSFGSVPSYTIFNASEETVSCAGAADAGSTILATLNFTCDAGSHSVVVNNLTIDGNNVGGGSIAINCGESATMGLEVKNKPETLFIGDQLTVALKISDLKLKDVDADANGTGGYLAWQAKISWDEELVLKAAGVDVKQPPNAVVAQDRDDVARTLAIGAAVDFGNPFESIVEGNVLNLTFDVVNYGTPTVTLSADKAETFLVSEKVAKINVNSGLTVAPASVEQLSFGAEMSLAVKGATKVQQGQTYWVPKGEKFTVGVVLNQALTTYLEAHADITFGPPSGDRTVNFQSAAVKNITCTPSLTTDLDIGNEHKVQLDCDTGGDTFSGDNIFNLTFACDATGPNGASAIDEQQIVLSSGSGTKLVDAKGDVTTLISKAKLTIRCVGEDTDKDKDGCTVTQEANITSQDGRPEMDPNRYDYWDTNNDQAITILDVLAYVQAFGQQNPPQPPSLGVQPPAGKPRVLDTDDNGKITFSDIAAVVLLFNTTCT